jgi:sulfur carrier protein
LAVETSKTSRPSGRLFLVRRKSDKFELMKLVINGTEREIEALNVAELVEALGMKGDRVAVELNREIVSRARWAESPLKDGDKLEIVHFVGGG